MIIVADTSPINYLIIQINSELTNRHPFHQISATNRFLADRLHQLFPFARKLRVLCP